MARSLLAALLVSSFAVAPDGGVCTKKQQLDPPPPPVPVTSATTPPIWAPPDTGGPLPTPAPPPSATNTNPDLVKARQLAATNDHKKIRTLLEKKVRAGKGSSEEAAILMTSCLALKDKACADAVKAKHPELEPAP
jgi:hypothetical protein